MANIASPAGTTEPSVYGTPHESTRRIDLDRRILPSNPLTYYLLTITIENTLGKHPTAAAIPMPIRWNCRPLCPCKLTRKDTCIPYTPLPPTLPPPPCYPPATRHWCAPIWSQHKSNKNGGDTSPGLSTSLASAAEATPRAAAARLSARMCTLRHRTMPR